MYWLISAYDVLDQVHLRVRCVSEEDESHGLDPAFHRSTTFPVPDQFGPNRDTLAMIATELNDLAYYPQDGSEQPYTG